MPGSKANFKLDYNETAVVAAGSHSNPSGSTASSGPGAGVSSLTVGAGLSENASTGAVSLSMTAGFVASATTMANMRALSSSGWANGVCVALLGYNNRDDGGGGVFEWNSADTQSDNGGTVIKLTGTATGRLHRVAASSIYQNQSTNTTLDVRWFGAIPDAVTDCQAAVAAAYASCVFTASEQNPALYFPAGQYLFKTKLTLSGSPVPGVACCTMLGDGEGSTIFVYGFASPDTCMFDISSFAYLTIKDISFVSQAGASASPIVVYVHSVSYPTFENVTGGSFSGTFLSINTASWLKIDGLETANVAGTQLLINGAGGVVSNVNIGNQGGTPALWVKNCNALDIHDGQVSGAGPYKSWTGSGITSNSSTFTITESGHGFLAGDWIYVSAATTHAGYVGKWKIASVATNTITVNSTANLGTDTVSFGSLWACGYFGGGLCTESSMSHILFNTSNSAPTGSCGLFLDGYASTDSSTPAGSVQGLRINNILCDYGSTKVYLHGIPSATYDSVNSYLYSVITSTATTFTVATANGTTNATSLMNGNWYVIQAVGTTTWTTGGAGSSTVGVVFQYNGAALTGSGVAGNLVAHSLRPGNYVHMTGGVYAGIWKIASVGTYTLTINSTVNLGNAITQPVEGDVFASTVMGVNFSHGIMYCNDSFGSVRVEGAINCNFSNLNILLGTSASGTAYGIVVCDDLSSTWPTIDISFDSCVLSDFRQATITPPTTLYAVDIDGPQVWGVAFLACTATGTQNIFRFSNDLGQTTPATIYSCNLVANVNGAAIGVMDNSSAPAGYIGEYSSNTATGVSVSTNVSKDITSISLTPGDWDVWGVVLVVPAGGTTTVYAAGWTNNASATFPSLPDPSVNGWVGSFAGGGVEGYWNVNPSPKRYSLSATTTIYLSTYMQFSGSTMAADGVLMARRVR